MQVGDEKLRSQPDAGASAAQQKLVAWWRILETEIAAHPKESLIAAVSMGVLLGWIIKRR